MFKCIRLITRQSNFSRFFFSVRNNMNFKQINKQILKSKNANKLFQLYSLYRNEMNLVNLCTTLQIAYNMGNSLIPYNCELDEIKQKLFEQLPNMNNFTLVRFLDIIAKSKNQEIESAATISMITEQFKYRFYSFKIIQFSQLLRIILRLSIEIKLSKNQEEHIFDLVNKNINNSPSDLIFFLAYYNKNTIGLTITKQFNNLLIAKINLQLKQIKLNKMFEYLKSFQYLFIDHQQKQQTFFQLIKAINHHQFKLSQNTNKLSYNDICLLLLILSKIHKYTEFKDTQQYWNSNFLQIIATIAAVLLQRSEISTTKLQNNYYILKQIKIQQITMIFNSLNYFKYFQTDLIILMRNTFKQFFINSRTVDITMFIIEHNKIIRSLISNIVQQSVRNISFPEQNDCSVRIQIIKKEHINFTLEMVQIFMSNPQAYRPKQIVLIMSNLQSFSVSSRKLKKIMIEFKQNIQKNNQKYIYNEFDEQFRQIIEKYN